MRLPFLRSRNESAPPPGAEDAVQLARTQARRRLVGALVLLVAGVVGFPILFETQPRPLPVDTPIISPPRGGTAAPRVPGAMVAPDRPLPPSPAVDGSAAVMPGAATPDAAPASVAPPSGNDSRATSLLASRLEDPPPAPTVPIAPPQASVPPPRPAAVAASPGPGAATAARSALAGEGAARFVVQVGAYTDLATLRETRQKVDKLGLRTYTQVIENDASHRTRVRVGPFATRAEAQAALSKLKAAGLPGNLLVL